MGGGEEQERGERGPRLARSAGGPARRQLHRRLRFVPAGLGGDRHLGIDPPGDTVAGQEALRPFPVAWGRGMSNLPQP